MTEAKQPDTRKKVAVRATKDGFFGGARRRAGQTFFVPEGVTGKWFVPVDASLAAHQAAVIEDANTAKRKAEDAARDAKVQADKDAAEAKKIADAALKDAKAAADAEALKKLGGMVPAGGSTQIVPPATKTPDDDSDIA